MIVTQQNTDWTLFEMDITTASETALCQFGIALGYATGTLWVDDIVMEKTPNRKLIYLPQIKYLKSSLGNKLYGWINGNSVNTGRLLVVFDPEAFSYDINGTSLSGTVRSDIIGGSLNSYKSNISYIKTSPVEAVSQEYFGLPANTRLPVTPLANIAHEKIGQVLAYNLTVPEGATAIANYPDDSVAVYARSLGEYGGKVIYFGVQPFGNSDLAVSDQGCASWSKFFSQMAGKVNESVNLDIWKFLLPATGNDVDLNFILEPGYGE